MLNSLGYSTEKHSIAQSFFVYETNGIFCTKIDLYFYSTDTATSGSILMPVMVELRPMVNGYPSAKKVVPGSQVTINAGNINVSTSGPTTATSFEFEEPVFLNGKQDYCFVVYTNSSKYQLYVAEGGEFIFGSTEKRIKKQPTLGSMFTSQNSITFVPVQDLDLTFKLHKAVFTHENANIILKNTDVPVKTLRPNPIKTTAGNGLVQVRQYFHGLQTGDVVTMRMNGGSVSNFDSDHLSGNHTIESVDPTGYKFTIGTNATASAVGGGSLVTATKAIPYSILYPHVQTLMPNDTLLGASFRGATGKSHAGNETAYSMNHSTDGYDAIKLNSNNTFNKMMVIASPKRESDTFNGGGAVVNRSAEVKVILSTTDKDNVTPMIDMQRASLSAIHYHIDRQLDSATNSPGTFVAPFRFLDETNANNGSSAAKHIVKPISLIADAVGLKIMFDANRPSTSDIQVYYRTATSDQLLAEQIWYLQPEETNNPSDDSPRVFREYQYIPGGQGGKLTSFTQFQVKFVMRTTNGAKVPVIRNLRIIALGT